MGERNGANQRRNLPKVPTGSDSLTDEAIKEVEKEVRRMYLPSDYDVGRCLSHACSESSKRKRT